MHRVVICRILPRNGRVIARDLDAARRMHIREERAEDLLVTEDILSDGFASEGDSEAVSALGETKGRVGSLQPASCSRKH